LQAWGEAAGQARTSLLEPDTAGRTVVNLYEQKDKLLYGFISTRRRLSLCRGKTLDNRKAKLKLHKFTLFNQFSSN
jgi:hypothetical protein